MESKKALYDSLLADAQALLNDCPWPLSAMANLAALLWARLPEVNWAGFYLRRGDMLYLGPFQGKIACTSIALGRGVCGTAAATASVQLVPDVHRFPGHIACDSASRAEVVIPLILGEEVVGVMDLDSPVTGRFDAVDAARLEEAAALLMRLTDWTDRTF